MKKLLIAIAATMIGIVAHAAAYTWSSTISVYDWDTEAAPIGAIQFWINGVDMGSFAFDENGDVNFSFGIDANDAITATCTINNFSDGAGKKDWSFDFTDAYIASKPSAVEAMKQMAFSAESAFGASLNLSLTVADNGFTAVPEPTSGLLFLIGMAGLALRRKRA